MPLQCLIAYTIKALILIWLAITNKGFLPDYKEKIHRNKIYLCTNSPPYIKTGLLNNYCIGIS